MKRIFYFIILFIALGINLNAQKIVLEGTYQGENLFVKNPFAVSGVGFCIYEVTVNGQLSTDEINSSAFEIDLSAYDYNIGSPVLITIKHKEGCKPIILNPEVLKSKSTFDIVDLKIDGNKLLWSTENESGKLPYIVQQFRWNKWINVATINGVGSQEQHNYSAKIRFNSGKNKFRIKQTDYREKPRYSKIIEYNNNTPKVTFTPKKVTDEIIFSSPTMFEIYDEYGEIIFKGYLDKINVSGLTKGKYYINYDNTLGEFIKK